jgi:hypothetical protein|tara:strand:- start:15656 stop:15895 length:240 start_codon:yes stop_codon:yes gene_type:complete
MTETQPWMVYLEWASFGLGALTVYFYGHNKKAGAVCGVTCALMFMAWGALSGLWGAFTINIGFFALHGRNLWRSIHVDA